MGKKVVIISIIVLVVAVGAAAAIPAYQEYRAEQRRLAKVSEYKLKIQTDIQQKNPQLYESLIKGIEQARKNVAEKPNDQGAWIELGAALHSIGELDEAEATYKKAIAISPITSIGWENLAEIYKHEERFAEAKDAYLQLIKNIPTETTGYVKLADMYANGIEGNIEDAKKVLAEGFQKTKSESMNVLIDKLNTEGRF